MPDKQKRVVEILAEIEHSQWREWSQTMSKELMEIRKFLRQIPPHKSRDRAIGLINERLDRWHEYWILYKYLPEEVKDQDRKYAEMVYIKSPIKCPLPNCGGTLELLERRRGNNKTPDLHCIGCGVLYRFSGHIKRKRSKDVK